MLIAPLNKGVFAQVHRLRQRLELPHLPAGVISATAIRTDDVPISITATCRAGGAAAAAIGVSRRAGGHEDSECRLTSDLELGRLFLRHRLGPGRRAADDGVIAQFSCGDLEHLR